MSLLDAVNGGPAELTRAQARKMTDKAKSHLETLWRTTYELHQRKAHTALGYRSWRAYVEAELGIGEDFAYKLVQAGEVQAILGDTSAQIPNQRVARELTPLRREPAKLKQAWALVVQEHGDTPVTAKTTRRILTEHGFRGNGGRSQSPSDQLRTVNRIAQGLEVLDDCIDELKGVAIVREHDRTRLREYSAWAKDISTKLQVLAVQP